MKEITRTVRFEIYPVGDKEMKNSFYQFFKDTLEAQKIAMQNAYNYLLQRDIIKDNIALLNTTFQNEINKMQQDIDDMYKSISGLDSSDKKYISTMKKINSNKNKLYNLKNNLNKEAEKTLDSALGYKYDNQVVKIAHALNEIKLYRSSYINAGVHYAKKDFNNDYENLKNGTTSPRVYKSTTLLRLDKTHLQNSSSIMIKKQADDHYFWKWHGWILRINLGSKASHAGNQRATLDRILSGEYSMGMGSVQRKGKKLFLLIPVTQEVHQPVLDPNRILGIDLGIETPAYGAFNFNPEWGRAFGDKYHILDFKTRIKALKRREQSKQAFMSGADELDKVKMTDRYKAIRNREANFTQTYNHTLAKQIVKHAVKNKCGVIRLEDINKEGLRHNTLGNWTYYQLQQYIKQKAEVAGIEVQMIPAKNTSKTCSKCGYFKSEFKLGKRDGKDGRQFHCPKCKLKINCDHNAAINIANGGVI